MDGQAMKALCARETSEGATREAGLMARPTLRLIVTTDLHGHIFPHDYAAGRWAPHLGLARLAGHVARLRRGPAISLLLDNGDFLNGTPLSDLAAGQTGSGQAVPHPMIAAMNAMGYTAATIGNHELDHGIDALRAALAGARFGLVASNLRPRRGAGAPLAPALLLIDRALRDAAGRRHRLRIGLVGALPPQAALWNREAVEGGGMAVSDIVRAIEAQAGAARAAGADLVIALAHSGLAPGPRRLGMENAALHVAALAEVDVVIAGHAHRVFPDPARTPAAKSLPGADAEAGTLHGKPAVMAGMGGSHLGVIDLALARCCKGWGIAARAVRALPACGAPETPETCETREIHGASALPGASARAGRSGLRRLVLAASARAHARAASHLDAPVGQSAVPLHAWFAGLAATPAAAFLALVQRHAARRLLEEQGIGGLPLISAAAPFRAGGPGALACVTDIPPGPLRRRHLADLCPFPNVLAVVAVSGAEVRGWLERAASAYHQISPGGGDQLLLPDDRRAYHLDALFGLDYMIDLSRPARYCPDGHRREGRAGRVVQLCYRGRPVAPNDRFLVATNSHRAGGGGHFPGAEPRNMVARGAQTMAEMLEAWLCENELSALPARAPWRFAPLHRAAALFDAGAGAAAHADATGLAGLCCLGPTAAGGLRYRLPLAHGQAPLHPPQPPVI